jgi:hypothetical protein
MIMILALLVASAQVAPVATQAELLENVVDASFRIYAPDNGLSGTCFVVERPAQGNKPANFVLVTAAHVLEGISAAEGRVAFRTQLPSGEMTKREVPFPLRANNKPLFRRHKVLDVAAIAISLPTGLHIKPYSMTQILDDSPSARGTMRLGRELWICSFPAKVEANPAGQGVLRRATIASRPYFQAIGSATFMADTTAFGGDSGAPVVVLEKGQPMVCGLAVGMIRQTEKTTSAFEERTTHTPLGLSIVIQSPTIRQVVDMID